MPRSAPSSWLGRGRWPRSRSPPWNAAMSTRQRSPPGWEGRSSPPGQSSCSGCSGSSPADWNDQARSLRPSPSPAPGRSAGRCPTRSATAPDATSHQLREPTHSLNCQFCATQPSERPTLTYSAYSALEESPGHCHEGVPDVSLNRLVRRAGRARLIPVIVDGWPSFGGAYSLCSMVANVGQNWSALRGDGSRASGRWFSCRCPVGAVRFRAGPWP